MNVFFFFLANHNHNNVVYICLNYCTIHSEVEIFAACKMTTKRIGTSRTKNHTREIIIHAEINVLCCCVFSILLFGELEFVEEMSSHFHRLNGGNKRHSYTVHSLFACMHTHYYLGVREGGGRWMRNCFIIIWSSDIFVCHLTFTTLTYHIRFSGVLCTIFIQFERIPFFPSQ